MDKRKATWADCWERVQEYLSELALYQADKTWHRTGSIHKYKQLKDDGRTQELSAVAVHVCERWGSALGRSSEVSYEPGDQNMAIWSIRACCYGRQGSKSHWFTTQISEGSMSKAEAAVETSLG
jgi:hypothetical protein